jgi:hypothetical protein
MMLSLHRHSRHQNLPNAFKAVQTKQNLHLVHQVPSHIFEAVLEDLSPAIVAAVIRSLALLLYAGHFHFHRHHCHF